MSQTKTLKEVLDSKNPGALSYVYNLGDDYLFIDSIKKNSNGENVIVHRHFDIRRTPIQEMTVDKFVNTFKDYSVNTRGLFGGKTRSKKHGFAKKRRTMKTRKTCKKRKSYKL
jgi:hypothetical protein